MYAPKTSIFRQDVKAVSALDCLQDFFDFVLIARLYNKINANFVGLHVALSLNFQKKRRKNSADCVIN